MSGREAHYWNDIGYWSPSVPLEVKAVESGVVKDIGITTKKIFYISVESVGGSDVNVWQYLHLFPNEAVSKIKETKTYSMYDQGKYPKYSGLG